MRVCYVDCHEAGLCRYLVIHIENLLHPLQLFYFHLWHIYRLSLVPNFRLCFYPQYSWTINQNVLKLLKRKSVKHMLFICRSLKTISSGEELTAYSLLVLQRPHRKQRVQQFFFVSRIRCHGNVFTEPFPSNINGDTHTDTQTDGRDLRSMSLRWVQLPWYTYQIW
jgi:hypothetical protein